MRSFRSIALLAALSAVGFLPSLASAQATDLDLEIGGDDVGTAESSILKGAAALRSADGQADLLESRAAVNLQESVDRYLDNQVEEVSAYNARRKAWREERKLTERKPLSQEGCEKLAEQRAPERLSSERLDAYSGELLWPPILDAKELKPYRTAVQKAFAKRASAGAAWTLKDYRTVKQNVTVMEKALRGVEEKLESKEFVGLLRFLESIDWEAQHNASGERIDIIS